MTYRAVGSSTGILDFVGDLTDGTLVPRNDFGSGDIPLSTDEYDELSNLGIAMLHLPVVLGAISLFHSVPNVPDLNLDSCIIAKIFDRTITDWTDQEIVDLNPNIKELIGANTFPITVARRKLGSSSTASFTQYLHTTCDTEWPIEMVGKEVIWNTETKICEGSAGMTACIRDTPGTIGYIDAGHGHSEGLVEIELKNFDGNFISSKEAGPAGIGAAAANANLPTAADQDFGAVELLNQPGPNTWPIVAMSYIYVRKDLSHIPDMQDRALLLAFLNALYEEEFISPCAELFGFTPVPEAVRTLAYAGIAELGTPEEFGASSFTFEYNTDKVAGQNDYVISGKRRSYGEIQRSDATGDIASLMQENLFLKSEQIVFKTSIDTLKADITDLKSNAGSVLGNDDQQTPTLFQQGSAFTDTDNNQLQAALVMASLSIVLWAVLGLFTIHKLFFKK